MVRLVALRGFGSMAVLSVLEVHLVGGPSSLAQLAGPAAIVIAALAGAYFAARYASRNVARELKAADRRLRLQLRHDQSMRSREATRETLDDVTDNLTNAMNSLAAYTAALMTIEQITGALEEASDESQKENIQRSLDRLDDEIAKRRQLSHDAAAQLPPAQLRLRLRFPENHPVYEAFRVVVEAVSDSEDEELKNGGEPRTDEHLAAAEEIRRRIPKNLNAYAAAVRDWMDESVQLD
jgi:hypothetical protein